MNSQDRALRALAHRDIGHLFVDVPARDRRDPRALKAWLTTAGEYVDDGQTAALDAARAAVDAWRAETDLRDTIARLWHDPKLRAQFTQADFDLAWSNPAAAIERLKSMSVSNTISPEADEALLTLYGVREYVEQSGGSFEAAPAPIPAGAGLDAEIAELRAKSVSGTISKAEDARYDALLTQRIARDGGVAEKAERAAEQPQAPSRKKYLLGRSAMNEITPRERAELDRIYSAEYPEDDGSGDPEAYEADPDILASVAAQEGEHERHD